MSLLQKTDNNLTATDIREMEVRALALQAAVTLMARNGEECHGSAMEMARLFETYIEEGRIPSDDD